jgi:large subunit ribosomal protein L21
MFLRLRSQPDFRNDELGADPQVLKRGQPGVSAPRCGDGPEGFRVYAIVRCGGRQEKVAVDDVLTVDKLTGDVGSTVMFPALLVVDGGNVVSAAAELSSYQVTAEILGATKGPKINIMHYRNKTGYKRRMGHRQPYTQVKVTGIKAGK